MKKYQEELNKFVEIEEKLEGLIESYPAEKREEILFDKWSLKDVVAHLNHWMIHDIDCLENLLRGDEPFWEPDVEEFNQRGVEERKNRPWDELYSEFIGLIKQLASLYKNLPEDLQNKRFWKDKTETPLTFLREDINHWEAGHIPFLESNLK